MRIDGRRIITFKIDKDTNGYVLHMADTENGTGNGYKKADIEIVPENIDKICCLVTNDKYAFVGYGNKYNDNIVLNYVISNKDMLKNAGKAGVSSCIDMMMEKILSKQNPDLEKQYKYVTKFNSIDLQRFLFGKDEMVSLDQFVKSSDFEFSDKEHDVDNIANILDFNKDRINARLKIEDIYGVDMFEKHEGVEGARLVKTLYAKANKVKPNDLKTPANVKTSVKLGDIIFPSVRFGTKQMEMFLDELSDETVNALDSWARYVALGRYELIMNLAGLRMNSGPAKLNSDKNGDIYNIDVASFYPSILSLYRIKPKQVNDVFLDIYDDMIGRRLGFKKTDKACSDAMKYMLNGVVGQYMIETSWLYDPEASLKIRVNGALMMLMLIERLYSDFDIKCVTIDGMFVKSRHPGMEESLRNIIGEWTSDTRLKADVTGYTSVCMLSNNDYIADSTTKGFFSYQRNTGHGGVPNIVRVAVSKNLTENIPVETTISNGTDISDYMTSVSSKGALEWEGCVFDSARYYYSDGERLCKVKDKTGFGEPELVPITDSGVTVTETMPKEMPDDVNYQYYISEAKRIIEKVNVQQLKLFQ